MKRFLKLLALFALLTLLGTVPRTAVAESPVKLSKLEGAVDLTAEAPFPFVLIGNASHLGEFTAYGEVEFVPGDEEGSLVGSGPVVMQAASGDLIVGIVTWHLSAPVDGAVTMSMRFSWRD